LAAFQWTEKQLIASFCDKIAELKPQLVTGEVKAIAVERLALSREAIAWRASSVGEDGRFDVAVSFDERRGYVGTHPELQLPVIALSLGGLRRKVEARPSPGRAAPPS
jgi:hypothetical protein